MGQRFCRRKLLDAGWQPGLPGQGRAVKGQWRDEALCRSDKRLGGQCPMMTRCAYICEVQTATTRCDQEVSPVYLVISHSAIWIVSPNLVSFAHSSRDLLACDSPVVSQSESLECAHLGLRRATGSDGRAFALHPRHPSKSSHGVASSGVIRASSLPSSSIPL